MNDKELIKKVAELWVENGGDVDGIDYCLQSIKDAVRELTEPIEKDDVEEIPQFKGTREQLDSLTP